MKTNTLNRRWGTLFRNLCCASALAASSAGAAVVWDFNPSNQNAPTGSTSQVFTSGGFQITARGYDNDGSTPNTPHQLYYKNVTDIDGAIERGLGLVGTLNNELQTSGGTPTNYIQLDLSSILSQGFVNGQIKVGSLQAGESFQLFGSNVQGTLGTAISGVFTGLAFDNQFVSIPSFGTFQFISIGSVAGDMLPVAFAADIAPIPEVGALLPIVALLAAVAGTSFLRRRNAPQIGAA
ncbi:MAG: hypothetical protein ABR589_10515 [Chthoniobacterales bacterium]